ncbi:11522_t:CDS:1 [Acaulospora morrowiae]|uniref:Protein-S-isoprenylcysteine O-methyltransferase n=1 Tax=Acaulospora morrowiae TaxID=94023 RepID=A0A9N9DJY3_9GLOM|nr:11522_t:CDS:1 [Acaulospora morrowiae]
MSYKRKVYNLLELKIPGMIMSWVLRYINIVVERLSEQKKISKNPCFVFQMFFKIFFFVFESVLAVLALILPDDVTEKSVRFIDKGIFEGSFRHFYMPGNIVAFVLISLWYIVVLLYQSIYYPDVPANEKLPGWLSLDIVVLPLLFLGTMLRISCFKTYDLLFAHELTPRREKKLVTTGPYAYVRHPLHTGFFLIVLGRIYLEWCLKDWYPDWIQKYFWPMVIIDLVLTSTGLHRVMKTEEMTLTRKYGKTWEEYARRTKRLIPMLV